MKLFSTHFRFFRFNREITFEVIRHWVVVESTVFGTLFDCSERERSFVWMSCDATWAQHAESKDRKNLHTQTWRIESSKLRASSNIYKAKCFGEANDSKHLCHSYYDSNCITSGLGLHNKIFICLFGQVCFNFFFFSFKTFKVQEIVERESNAQITVEFLPALHAIPEAFVTLINVLALVVSSHNFNLALIEYFSWLWIKICWQETFNCNSAHRNWFWNEILCVDQQFLLLENAVLVEELQLVSETFEKAFGWETVVREVSSAELVRNFIADFLFASALPSSTASKKLAVSLALRTSSLAWHFRFS